MKGYRCWNPVTKKCIISRDVIFKEDELLVLQSDEASLSDSPVEVEQSGFEVELTEKVGEWKSFEHTDQIHTLEQVSRDNDNKEVIQPDDLVDYNLTRDRTRREVAYKFGYVDIVVDALQVDDEVNEEPRSYKELVTNADSLLWKKDMSEEF